MNSKRHKGFVVGFDGASEGRTVWKVRVKDSESPHDGQKLIVASVSGRMELARGLNVNFAIGTIDDQSGTKVLRAVDVCLEASDDQTISNVRNQVKRPGGQS